MIRNVHDCIDADFSGSEVTLQLQTLILLPAIMLILAAIILPANISAITAVGQGDMTFTMPFIDVIITALGWLNLYWPENRCTRLNISGVITSKRVAEVTLCVSLLAIVFVIAMSMPQVGCIDYLI